MPCVKCTELRGEPSPCLRDKAIAYLEGRKYERAGNFHQREDVLIHIERFLTATGLYGDERAAFGLASKLEASDLLAHRRG